MAPLASGADRIAGVELGAVPLAVSLSIELDLPYIMVRKERKGHGTKAGIEGEFQNGDTILFVEDVTTTAETLKKAILDVRAQGGQVEKAITVVDRNEGAVANLGLIDVQLIALVTVDRLLK
jgi:orotate phosphoribosyltransferase